MTECREEVWDYASGFIVCVDTGEVVDRIYDYGGSRAHAMESRSRMGLLKARTGYSRNYRNYLALERLAKRLTKGKPWLTVNYVKLYEQGRLIKTITSLKSTSAVGKVISGGIHVALDKVLEVIEEVEPAALARTERAKYALAYIVYLKALGKCMDFLELAEMFNVSQATIKRLEEIANRVYSKAFKSPLLGGPVFQNPRLNFAHKPI